MPRKKQIGKRRGIKKVNKSYSDQDKRQAVISYMVHGTLRAASEDVGMPFETLRDWKKTEWWLDMVHQCRDDVEDKIEADLVEILTLSATRVKNSLTEGDEKLVWDAIKKKHNKIRVLPTGKEAAVMMGVSYDKRRLTLNMPTAIRDQGGGQAMQNLMQQFQKLAQENAAIKVKKINSIEGELDES